MGDAQRSLERFGMEIYDKTNTLTKQDWHTLVEVMERRRKDTTMGKTPKKTSAVFGARGVKTRGKSYMTPSQLHDKCTIAFGTHAWKQVMITLTGKNMNTICRYANGDLPVPRWLATLVDILSRDAEDSARMVRRLRRAGEYDSNFPE